MRLILRALIFVGFLITHGVCVAADVTTQNSGAKVENPAYPDPKVVFDFYFAHPDEINTGLYWIRSLIQPLMEAPYNEAPEMMNIVVVIHGTEIVTLAKKKRSQIQRSGRAHALLP